MEIKPRTRLPQRAAYLCLSALALWYAGSGRADEGATYFGEALKKGQAFIALRYRYELVTDDAPAVRDKDASASTLRTTVSYRSLPYHGFSLFLEAENVTAVGNEELYNNAGAGSLSNGVTDRPVVADPEITEINQALLRLAVGKTAFQAGRQEINIGNHRFVGNVGWRQNHQSFDSFSISDQSLPKTTLQYHYADNVNRIFGDNKQMASHLFNGDVKITDSATLSFYAFLLDYDRPADAALSTATYGLRWHGKREFNRGSGKASAGHLLYAFEFADQSDFGDNPSEVDASYYLAELGGGFSGVTLQAGLEVLEGSPGEGKFTTPLATLHKFQGWADKFLVTPSGGIEDLYLSLSGGAGDFKWIAVYHDFSAETGDADYGTELDLQLTYKTRWNQTFGLKGALYDAENHAANTDKIMFWTAYKFGR